MEPENVPDGPRASRTSVSRDTSRDYRCGYGNWRPAWLQLCVSPKFFMAFVMLLGVCQGAYRSYFTGCLSTIEKRFELPAKATGLILTADNISTLFSSLVVGYYAAKISRPKFLAFGTWITAAGCFLSSLPYFVYGPGVHLLQRKTSQGFASGTCPSGSGEYGVETSSPAVTVIALLFVGNMLNGVGVNIFSIASVTYADDNVKKKNSPIYIGILMSTRTMGPLIGFLLSSTFLSIYEDPFHDPGLSRKHQSWIGAWWMGFLVSGVCLIAASVPISLFPKQIKKSAVVCQEENRSDKDDSLLHAFRKEVKGILKAFRRVSQNPVLMWKMISLVLLINGIGGYMSNFPKYVEKHFDVPPSTAVLMSGPIKVLAATSGILISGVIIRYVKPTARTIVLFSAFCDLCNLIAFFSAMFVKCDRWPFGGSSVIDSNKLILNNACNGACRCSTSVFQPVCDATSKTMYFSPCFAGCSTWNSTTNMASNCTCLPQETFDPSVVIGKSLCNYQCGNAFLVVAATSIGQLISCLSSVGSFLLILRCVDPKEKTLALGIYAFCANFLGAIPYPLIYGAIFDSTCLIWRKNGGRRGNCWVHDLDKLRYYFHGITIMFLGLSILSQLVAAYYSNRVKDMYDDDESKKTTQYAPVNKVDVEEVTTQEERRLVQA